MAADDAGRIDWLTGDGFGAETRSSVVRPRKPARAQARGVSARDAPSLGQRAVAAALAIAVIVGVLLWRVQTEETLRWTLAVLFSAVVVCKAAAPLARARRTCAPTLADSDLPSYAVIVPLYREATVAAQLVRALGALDYPAAKLAVTLVLEVDDVETLAAVALHAADLAGLKVLIAPEGAPRTKPRALNVALAEVTAELLVVYDAEDRPHPGQLREAAARFAAGPPALACLQAPLRIDGARTWLQRQFALEYAAQFEAALPALCALGLPFPLGGTSNHFRVAALRSVGGWDAWNVTEDADLGFRLAAAGARCGMLASPTYEDAPRTLAEWLPQRARWVKGYMQTLVAHARGGWMLRPRQAFALLSTLGVAVACAVLHGPMAAMVLVVLARGAVTHQLYLLQPVDAVVLVGGWTGSTLTIALGARAAGVRLRTVDALMTLAYWPLQSVAAVFALHQLATRPHHWNKTPHSPHQPAA